MVQQQGVMTFRDFSTYLMSKKKGRRRAGIQYSFRLKISELNFSRTYTNPNHLFLDGRSMKTKCFVFFKMGIRPRPLHRQIHMDFINLLNLLQKYLTSLVHGSERVETCNSHLKKARIKNNLRINMLFYYQNWLNKSRATDSKRQHPISIANLQSSG